MTDVGAHIGGAEPPANVHTVTPIQSVGISPKAWAAGLVPQLTALLTIGITFLVMGTLDKLALVAALVQVGTGLLAGITVWATKPGKVEVAVPHPDATLMGVGARAEAQAAPSGTITAPPPPPPKPPKPSGRRRPKRGS